MVPSGIKVPPGKFDKNNNRTPWNNCTPLKTQKVGCSLKEHFLGGKYCHSGSNLQKINANTLQLYLIALFLELLSIIYPPKGSLKLWN